MQEFSREKVESVRRLCWRTIIDENPCYLISVKAKGCEFLETQKILDETGLGTETLRLYHLVNRFRDLARKKLMDKFKVTSNDCETVLLDLTAWLKELVLSDEAKVSGPSEETRERIVKLGIGAFLIGNANAGRKLAPQLSGKNWELDPDKLELIALI